VSAPSRREFLGAAGMSVAAVVACSLSPAARLMPLGPGTPLLAALAGLDPQGDWHVDDICGHLPRYAHPIPYLHDASAPDLAVLAAPIDRQFVS